MQLYQLCGSEPSYLLTLWRGLQKEKRGEVSNHDLSARNFTFARLIAMTLTLTLTNDLAARNSSS